MSRPQFPPNKSPNEPVEKRSCRRWRRVIKRVVLAVSAVCAAADIHAAIPDSERQALVDLYDSANGASWLVSTNWTTSSGTMNVAGTECTWYGVVCDSTGSTVIGINLPADNLSGKLSALEAFTNLQTMHIDLNPLLIGPIPALSQLSHLQSFTASYDSLTGSIPALAGLVDLQTFYVDNNYLTGSIPSLTGLTSLNYFSAGNIAIPINLSDYFASLAAAITHGNNQLSGSIPDLTGLTQLTYFQANNNQLSGSLPALDGLTNLQAFLVAGNQLSGTIPSLQGLDWLSDFDVRNNKLTGSIPPLSGLPALTTFLVSSNRLTGAIPALSGTGSLISFVASNNQLSGPIPELAGMVNLYTFAVDRNQLTGTIPSLSGLTTLAQFFANNNQLTGAIPSLDGLPRLTSFFVNSNQLSGAIPSLDGSPALTEFFVGDNQLSGSVPAAPASLTLTAASKITANLCPNPLSASSDTSWDTATWTSPWYSACTESIDLDQHGLTGSWYNPVTGGQGLVLEEYPDLIGAGKGLLFGGWYTFDTTADSSNGLRWYTLQGAANDGNGSIALTIYASYGGNFNAAPALDTATVVGTATLSFSDCTHGSLLYNFNNYDLFSYPSNLGMTGRIPLTRLTGNVTCGTTGDNGSAASSYLLSGSWYDPATSGQGMLFDINPEENLLFAGWYTFAANGDQFDDGSGQRWYTLQTDKFTSSTRAISNVPIYSTAGGEFNTTTTTTTTQVGTASITFTSCSAMTLGYSFTNGTRAALTGSINLVRVGPAPAGCSF